MCDRWECYKQQLPNLRLFAYKILTIPATSAPSERLWSIAARILVKDRARLDSEIVSSLLFIKENGSILKKHILDVEGRNRYLPYVYEEDLNEEEINNLLEELGDDNYEM